MKSEELESEIERLKRQNEDYFSKLQAAKQHNKQLMIEIGMLSSEIEELRHEKAEYEKMTPEEKTAIKKGKFYISLRDQLTEREQTINHLRKTNSQLIEKLAQIK